MSRLKAHVSIGSDRNVLNGAQITIETPDGTFQIGVDNNGETYLSIHGISGRISTIPQAANRMLIKSVK